MFTRFYMCLRLDVFSDYDAGGLSMQGDDTMSLRAVAANKRIGGLRVVHNRLCYLWPSY